MKNNPETISLLQIQKDFGVDWAFSEERSVFSDASKAKQISNNISENSNVVSMPKPKVPKENSASSFSSQSFSNGSKSTEEWVKLSADLAAKSKTLKELKEVVSNFEGLAIKKTATNTVFAEGNPNAKLMLIGEAPGENEDLEGRPFCGVSGRLLDTMVKHTGFTRSGDTEKNSFYITNSIFWRPPGNRKPTPEEIAICKPFVEKHIALINPKVIILVGATATYSVLGSNESISKIKGAELKYSNPFLEKPISCFAIYHPSFLLRQPTQKKNAWFDLLKIKNFFETV